MAIYLIGYEGRTERPYDQLQEAMDREGGVKLIDGLWALDVEKDATELRDWVRARLRSSRVPAVISFRQQLPYNEMGKILRRVLRDELSIAT